MSLRRTRVVDEVVRLAVAVSTRLTDSSAYWDHWPSARPRIVENQLDRRPGDRFSARGAVEDDVLHRLAARVVPKPSIRQNPAHGVP